MDKQRFKSLYQLAHGGDMEAKADLWLEFQFAYDHDPLPDFMQGPPLEPGCGATSVPSEPNGGTSSTSSKTISHQPTTPNRITKGGAQ